MSNLVLQPIVSKVCGLFLLLTYLSVSSGESDSSVAIAKANLPSRALDTANTHLIMGNPSDAKSDPQYRDNYLMLKRGYALSYNSKNGTPNWVSWQLNSSWLGNSRRKDDWNSDPTLPKKMNRVTPNSYKGSGYDRGHMTPSHDRTKSDEENSETFLMTNILPQAQDNNRGPWAELEKYSRELVKEGKELYIIAGGMGKKGEIADGKVSVPKRVWKVIVVLERPGLGINSVSASTRTIAVDMPNENGISPDWQQFKTSIDKLEADINKLEPNTKYDFLSSVPTSIQAEIESRIDGESSIFNFRNIFGLGIFALIAAIATFIAYQFRYRILKFLGIA
jgi:endonuclease G, mitochondrial